MKLDELTEGSLNDICKMLKALSDPNRLKIMKCLHDTELCVGDIVDQVKTGQANVSKHLQLLGQVQLVKSRREGTSIYYSLYDPRIKKMCEAICQGYNNIVQSSSKRK